MVYLQDCHSQGYNNGSDMLGEIKKMAFNSHHRKQQTCDVFSLQCNKLNRVKVSAEKIDPDVITFREA